MKKILFALSILTLLSYGCNRSSDQDAGAVQGAGSTPQEQQSDSTASPNDQGMGADPAMDPAMDPEADQPTDQP